MSASKARLFFAVLFLTTASGVAEAQTGSVTGRVSASDTRLPLGRVTLQVLDVNRPVA